MYAHPHPGSATLLKDIAKPWRRHVWWYRGLVPHWGRAGSGRETREKKKHGERDENQRISGRCLGNRRKDKSSRKQTYFTFQSLIRLALRAMQFVPPLLYMLNIQMHIK